MKPVPVAFHIGPLEVHTYGIGLALTFWFGYRYFARRLRAHGYDDQWLAMTFVWIVVAAIAGARAMHVLAHTRYYGAHPADILAIWDGGLSSFGGLALAIPVGLISARRRCPELKLSIAGDLVAPVLVAAWAMGRLLGPQMMYAGGGKPTTSWYGMYYAGEVGKRLPVPIFQAIECLAVYAIALLVERYIARHSGPIGVVTCMSAGLWGLSRYFDESVYLPHDNGTIGVEVAGLVMFGGGLLITLWLGIRQHALHKSLGVALSPVAGQLTSTSSTGGTTYVDDPWAAPRTKVVQRRDSGTQTPPVSNQPGNKTST